MEWATDTTAVTVEATTDTAGATDIAEATAAVCTAAAEFELAAVLFESVAAAECEEAAATGNSRYHALVY
jgi:hypothetical protein